MASARILGILAAALALAACGDAAARTLEAVGLRTLQPVPVEEARAAVDAGRARWVQRRAPDERLAPLADAFRLRDDEAPPQAWREGTTRWLVVASDRDAAFALAARLRRAGVSRVGVVTGDVRSLGDRLTARAAQPDVTRDHRSQRPGADPPALRGAGGP
jgi:hypothetical protein